MPAGALGLLILRVLNSGPIHGYAIAQRILNGIPNAPQDYIKFLATGSSRSPLEVFKIAGVDMTNTQPIIDAFAMLEEYIDRLGTLTNK